VKPSYRERLVAALEPKSDAEHDTVAYLAVTTPHQADVVLGMVERAINTARAEGYERGWAEGLEHVKQHPRIGE